MGNKNKSFNQANQGNKAITTSHGPKSPEQRRQEREERSKRNVELAAKPNARVMEVGTPYSDVIFQIHKQMDMVWMHLKARSGESGGVSYEELAKITEELQEHIVDYHNLTKKLAKMVGWSYRTPDKLKPVLEKMNLATAGQTESAPVTVAPEKIHALPAKPAAKPQAQKSQPKEKKVATK